MLCYVMLYAPHHLIYDSVDPHESVPSSKGILIGSIVLHGSLSRPTHTHRQTDRTLANFPTFAMADHRYMAGWKRHFLLPTEQNGTEIIHLFPSWQCVGRIVSRGLCQQFRSWRLHGMCIVRQASAPLYWLPQLHPEVPSHSIDLDLGVKYTDVSFDKGK